MQIYRKNLKKSNYRYMFVDQQAIHRVYQHIFPIFSGLQYNWRVFCNIRHKAVKNENYSIQTRALLQCLQL